MPDTLKRCPFCGAKARFMQDTLGIYVVCPQCDSGSPIVHTMCSAAHWWNRRPVEHLVSTLLARLSARSIESDGLTDVVQKLKEACDAD